MMLSILGWGTHRDEVRLPSGAVSQSKR